MGRHHPGLDTTGASEVLGQSAKEADDVCRRRTKNNFEHVAESKKTVILLSGLQANRAG